MNLNYNFIIMPSVCSKIICDVQGEGEKFLLGGYIIYRIIKRGNSYLVKIDGNDDDDSLLISMIEEESIKSGLKYPIVKMTTAIRNTDGHLARGVVTFWKTNQDVPLPSYFIHEITPMDSSVVVDVGNIDSWFVNGDSMYGLLGDWAEHFMV